MSRLPVSPSPVSPSPLPVVPGTIHGKSTIISRSPDSGNSSHSKPSRSPVSLVNGRPVTSSLAIAAHFEKPHADVLKAIRKVMDECPPEFGLGNFSESSYLNEQGKEQPCFDLTRDAFSLVAMGFTGKKALAWKIRYVEAFNAMEAEIAERMQNTPHKSKPRQPSAEITARAVATSLRALSRMKVYPDEMRAVFAAKAVVALTGEPLQPLLPPVTNNRETWMSPTALAEHFQVSSQRIGRLLTSLGLHGGLDPDHNHSYAVWNKALHSDKQVSSYLYDPAVVIPRLAEAMGKKNGSHQPGLLDGDAA